MGGFKPTARPVAVLEQGPFPARSLVKTLEHRDLYAPSTEVFVLRAQGSLCSEHGGIHAPKFLPVTILEHGGLCAPSTEVSMLRAQRPLCSEHRGLYAPKLLPVAILEHRGLYAPSIEVSVLQSEIERSVTLEV